MVCITKKVEGLGIKNLLVLNTAFLGKWNWRFALKKKRVSLEVGYHWDVWGRNGLLVLWCVKGRF